MRLLWPVSWLTNRTLKGQLHAVILILGLLPLIGLAVVTVAVSSAQGDNLTLVRAARGSTQLERINGLIFAVAMESRGIYMSPDWQAAEPFARDLTAYLADLRIVAREWQHDAISTQRSNATELAKRIDSFITVSMDLVHLARDESTTAARLAGENAANRAMRMSLNESLRTMARAYEARMTRANNVIDRNDRNVLLALVALAAIAALAIACGFAVLSTGLLAPLLAIKSSMLRLAKGDLKTKIDGLDRNNEIGDMARSVEVLQTSSIEHQKLSRESALLADLNEWMQCCKSLDELYRMVAQFMSLLLPDCPGSLYVYANSRDVLESTNAWNGGKITAPIHPDDCWALRRGRMYTFGNKEIDFPCGHTGPTSTGKYCCIPILAHGETIGLLHLSLGLGGEEKDASSAISILEQQRLGVVCAEQISLAIANVKLRDQLRDQSIRDPLTGLYNRRYLMETCRREFARAARNGQCVGILSLDVDHFKKFNDNHGHDAGDEVLRAVGECLQRNFREEDIPCRFGGEEFVVIVSGARSDDVIRKAEDLRTKIEALVVRYVDGNLPRLTVSVGVAAFPRSGGTPQEVLKAADEALYQAKEDGRNCVRVAPSLADPEEPAEPARNRDASPAGLDCLHVFPSRMSEALREPRLR